MRRYILWAIALPAMWTACASPREQADTVSVLAIDTVKPATTALQSPAGATTSPDTTPSSTGKTTTGTKARTTGTKTATKQGETKELGRDSIIRVDTKDKRRMLPPADTTKEP